MYNNFKIRSIIECLILIILTVLISVQLSAQDNKDSVKLQEKQDSIIQNIDTSFLTNFNTDSVKKYFKASDTLISYQLNKIEKYTLDLNNMNARLRRGFDTSEIIVGLPKTDTIIGICSINLTGFRGQVSLKILTTTKNLLIQIKKYLSEWQKELSDYNNDLNSIRDRINSINNDKDLFIMPKDSLLFLEYLRKIKPLGEKTSLVDSITNQQFKALGVIQNKVSTNYLTVMELIDEANMEISNFHNLIFKKEFNYIWEVKEKTSEDKNFNSIVLFSIRESSLLLHFYLERIWTSRLIVLFIGVLFFFRMRKKIFIIRNVRKDPELILSKSKHISKHLFVSSMLLILMMISFVYPAPPQSFTQVLWGFRLLVLLILLRDKLNFSSGLQLVILVLLFYVTGFTNMLIQATPAERMIQLLISLVSIGLGIWFLLSKRRVEFFRFKYFKPLIILFLIMSSAALVFNIFGRVTLAKILNTGASYGVVEAIILFVFIEIVIDIIYLLKEASKNKSRLTAYFEYKGLVKKLQKILGIFAVITWVVLFTQNLQIFDFIFGGISEFFSTERQVGDLVFSFGSIAIFIFTIWISSVLSQLISFVFGDQKTTNTGEVINKLGSTMLIVRIGILATGVIVAFGVSGIPLDKLAMVIGALGVGIGFGLQTIVNNLVSGIVLAFEKPIQIGDVIDVGGIGGTVKDIGVRSSVLTTFDGSELIIPNGDMLSQHLINWTRNNSARRITVPVGVAYGTDIEKVKEIILQIVDGKENVLNIPKPIIRVTDFGDNSVELKVYFWADNSIWVSAKSEVMEEIYKKLADEGIEIPFPQRDLHIRSIDEDVISEISKKDKRKLPPEK